MKIVCLVLLGALFLTHCVNADAPKQPTVLERDITQQLDSGIVGSVFVDLGKFKVGQTVNQTLLLRNKTSSKLTLIKANPSCGCTSVEFGRNVCEVGEAVEVSVKFASLPNSMPEMFYYVTFETRGDIERLSLAIKLEIEDGFGFQATRGMFRATPIAKEEDARNEQEFKLPFVVGNALSTKDLEISASNSLSYLKWRFEGEGNSLSVVGRCTTDDIPPDSSSGNVVVALRSRPTQSSTQFFSVLNPEAIELSPSRIILSKEKVGDHSYRGSALLRIDLRRLKEFDVRQALIYGESDGGWNIEINKQELSKSIVKLGIVATRPHVESSNSTLIERGGNISELKSIRVKIVVGNVSFEKNLGIDF